MSEIVPATPDVQQSCDVVLGEDQAVSQTIARELIMKGYSTIDLKMEEDALDNIFREAKSLDRSGHFKDMPVEVADGLLGVKGSARVAQLPEADVPEGINLCDNILTNLFNHIAGYAPSLGFYARTRTAGLVLEAAADAKIGEKPPELEEADVRRWLATFEMGRLFMLIFMGPGSGTITLKAFDRPDMKPFEVPTSPGTALIIRADILSGRHVVTGRKHYALGCFLLQDGTIPGPNATAALPRPPLAVKLDSWAQERLQELAFVDIEDMDKAVAGYQSPIWWRSSYDHTYHSSNKIAFRGISVKFPGNHDPEETFITCVPGCDVVTEVPTMRWDVNVYWDSEPDQETEAWTRGKVLARHGGFIDGADLFDAKFFKIAPAEVKGMDPMQRIICECGYESLWKAGRTKNNLLNSATGVFVAAQMAEVTLIDAGPEEAGGCEQRAAGTGFNTAIMSNRFSFVMGMQGPSVMVDTDASSSLMVLQLAMASCFPGKVMSTMACATGMALSMTPLTWLGRLASGEMTTKGRCFSFDACGSGWVRSDGNGTLAMDNYLDRVNDQLVHDESRVAVGIVSGCTAQHVGQVATLNTPSAPATMKCMSETCRNAGVALTSIDACEAHADAQQFHDAVETTALRKVLCHGGDMGRLPVPFATSKSNFGNAIQAAGMISVVKRIWEMKCLYMCPNVHLVELNPYIAYEDREAEEEMPAHFQTEAIAYPFRTGLVALSNQGFGGTIASAVFTGFAEKVKPTRQLERQEALTFWPGGGGKLEDAAKPVSGYDIVGSWSSWATPERMELEADGIYTYTVTLGINGSEQFRILLDADYSKALHPSSYSGVSGEAVQGPAETEEEKESTQDCCWSIDGYTWSGSQAALADAGATAPSPIGDKYKVRLQVAGKWRVVTWEKIPDYVDKAPLAQLMQDALIQGTYFLTGSFNDWQFEEMTLEGGLHCGRIMITKTDDAQFLIVRNKDMNQAFYPDSSRGATDRADGPTISAAIPSFFVLPGNPGDAFKVRFQRVGAEGSDDKRIYFEKDENA